MRPQKNLFSVRDITAVVQNGESDFEMDSDSTDASDSENDGGITDDPNEEDKENQKPFDCPASHENFKAQAKKPFMLHATSILTPQEYFQKFVTQGMIENLTKNTNEYSLQKHGTSVNTNVKEIEMLLGMYLKMGLVQMAGVRMYWETETRYSPVSDVMPRNRFQALLTSLHFTNNLTVSEKDKKDKLWKLRPWLNSFTERCLQMVPEEHNSVEEMAIPFKAKYKFPLKSHRWNIYIFWHTIILGVFNSWLLYKQDCKTHKLMPIKTLNRRQFQAQIASSLILINTCNTSPKGGRTSPGRTATLLPQKRKHSSNMSSPAKRPSGHLPLDVRKDMTAHFPAKTTRGRCRHCDNGHTTVFAITTDIIHK